MQRVLNDYDTLEAIRRTRRNVIVADARKQVFLGARGALPRRLWHKVLYPAYPLLARFSLESSPVFSYADVQ